MLCSFKQKAAYDIRISDWSSDVCSSEQTVTATIAAPDSGDTSEISGSATAIIDSVADNPSAKFDGEVADAGEGCSPEHGEGASDTEIERFLGLARAALDTAAAHGSRYGDTAPLVSAHKPPTPSQDATPRRPPSWKTGAKRR